MQGGLNADSVTIFASWVNVSGFTITGGDPSGVYITSFSQYNTIENNMISDNFDSGVQIYWFSDHNTIANNTILNHSNYGVLILDGNDYNKVADNMIENTTTSSIFIANPSGVNPNLNNNIANNMINKSQYGVYLYNLNDNNIIEGNFINNSQYGIMLSTSNDNNEITRNTILASSSVNLYLWNSNNNNLIYHNNFLNVLNLAYDDGVNTWNLSYPGGGNFWSNYSGGDNKSGPLQNIYGNDGFGDVPIILGGGSNKDYYPLWPNWDALKYYKPAPGWKNVCEYAMGDIEVGVIFVESNGSIDSETENWSSSRKSEVLGEIADALTWWEAQEPDANLNFSINDLGSRNTSYEPISRVNTDSVLFIGEILGNMGFTSGNFQQRLLAFNHWLREQADTNWAFTIFIVDSFNDSDGYFANPPAYAWAWWFVGGIVMSYDNGNWGIARMNNVTAHEVGHMFYASDEYTSPGERSGYLNALEVDNSGMLMDINNLVLSSGSELQIGWRDSDSDDTLDILDTEPNTYLVPYEPDPTYNDSPIYTGHAVVVPYPNDNPYGYSLDVTLNNISNVQYRIDNGSWQNATAYDGAFNDAIEKFSFALSGLSSGTHFIEARAFNNVNNGDPTYSNDTITILSDLDPPEILETTIDVPVSGDYYNVTANVIDNLEVDTVWLEYLITSSDGYFENNNVSMNLSAKDSYWNNVTIWGNTTWFNYTISASDTSGNWNVTSLKALHFRVHNLNSGFGYTTIQYAIDDSDTLDRHTIFAENGTYYENVVVHKSINLTGEDRDTTIIDGGGVGNAVYVSANWVNLTGFTITGGGPNFEEAGLILLNVSYCQIYGNNISTNDYYGLYLLQSSNNFILNNNVYDNIHHGIAVIDSDYNSIDNNLAYNNYHGILVTGINNSVIYNILHDNLHEGIVLSGADNSTVVNNTAYSNGWRGIYLRDSNQNVIINNTLFDNTNGGMIVWDSSLFNKVINNNVSSNLDYGIWIYSLASKNIISNNNFSNNVNQGILIELSNDNNVTNNSVSNNGYGIYVTASLNNRIYHNSINNTNQAYDDSIDGNQWDNGYPSGGNYWSDYSGKDLFSGPDQDIIGNDGIGDTNYTIDSDSKDNYPLMGEIGDYLFLYEGWNLISLPFLQTDTNLNSVLSPIAGSYDAVQWYNTSDANDHWKHHHIAKPSGINDLEHINHTMGFLIHITDTPGVVFEYPGTPLISNQSINLDVGWNLVGYPSLGNYNRTVGLNKLKFGTDVDAISWLDSETKTWNFLNENDYFVPGRGYWIHSKVDIDWEVPL
jgi:parallel beta-helix repeat protein